MAKTAFPYEVTKRLGTYPVVLHGTAKNDLIRRFTVGYRLDGVAVGTTSVIFYVVNWKVQL
jgi:hypothetical protein